ncbi:MAG: DUF5665 domain-containing protein [Clostridia bacterium]|nr:DUF5665 domain-containing protein [Clostridia bacterium]
MHKKNEPDLLEELKKTSTQPAGPLTDGEQREMLALLRWLRDYMIRYNLVEAIRLSFTPRRLIWVNFLTGLFRALGYTIGFAVLLTVLVWLINTLNLVSLPIIGDWISEILRYID